MSSPEIQKSEVRSIDLEKPKGEMSDENDRPKKGLPTS